MNEWEKMHRVILKWEVLRLSWRPNCVLLDLIIVLLLDNWLDSIVCFFNLLLLSSDISLEGIVLSKKFFLDLLLSSLNNLFLNNRSNNFRLRLFLFKLPNFLFTLIFIPFQVAYRPLEWDKFSSLTVRDHASYRLDDIVNRSEPNQHLLMMASALSWSSCLYERT